MRCLGKIFSSKRNWELARFWMLKSYIKLADKFLLIKNREIAWLLFIFILIVVESKSSVWWIFFTVNDFIDFEKDIRHTQIFQAVWMRAYLVFHNFTFEYSIVHTRDICVLDDEIFDLGLNILPNGWGILRIISWWLSADTLCRTFRPC